MKTIRVDKFSLSVRIMNLAADYDTYEFMDAIDNEEQWCNDTKKMLESDAGIRSLLAFISNVIENTEDDLSSRDLPDKVVEQFASLLQEAISIRRLLHQLMLDNYLFTNNARKLAGLPLLRKKDNRKRHHTRCEADEAVDAFLAYCNGR